jgi:hypothetical protein
MVDDIITGRNGWREIIANDQASSSTALRLNDKCAPASINSSQKATAGQKQNKQGKCAISRDGLWHPARAKERVDAGEPTEIVALDTGKRLRGWMRWPLHGADAAADRRETDRCDAPGKRHAKSHRVDACIITNGAARPYLDL